MSFLKQSCAQCLKLEWIIHRYLNGILNGLTFCVVTLIIGSTTFVGTTCTIGFYFFMLWHVCLALPVFPQFE